MIFALFLTAWLFVVALVLGSGAWGAGNSSGTATWGLVARVSGIAFLVLLLITIQNGVSS